MRTSTFSATWASNWQAMNLSRPEKKMRARFTAASFEDLKQAYVQKYGYVIKIPEFDDIVHLTPTQLMTPAEIKARKSRQLQNILASPSSEWYKSYASAMTWIDNVQDTSSIIYPTFRMLVRWAPRVFSRFLPVAGWTLLAFDVLQLLNTYMRNPITPMAGKRSVCEVVKSNPFSKQSQFKRMDRIRNWDPKFSDLLQVLQTTDNIVGVGLSLGAIVGFFSDMAHGLYRYASGDRVRFATELPPLNLYELNASAANKAAAILNTTGQTFEDTDHFWWLATQSAATTILTPVVEQYDLASMVTDPLKTIIDAPEPTDPITIDVIREAGLSVQDGVRWPIDLSKKLPMQDFSDYVIQHSREVFTDFCLRHSHDWYGFIAAGFQDQSVHDLLDALEPGSEVLEENTPFIQVMFIMIKNPILPRFDTNPTSWQKFAKWVNDFAEINERVPQVRDIKDELNALEIPYDTTYPAEWNDQIKNLFPEGIPAELQI